jgi:hypothetical protein
MLGSKRSRESLEKHVLALAARMARKLAGDNVNFRMCEAMCRLWLLASYDVLRLEVPQWCDIMFAWEGNLTRQSWAQFTATLRCTDQWFMDYLRELDPAQLGELSFSAFKSHWTEVSVDSGSDESILPPAILKLMYAFVKDRDVSLYARVHQLLQFPLRPDILTKTGHAELEVAVTNKFAAKGNEPCYNVTIEDLPVSNFGLV